MTNSESEMTFFFVEMNGNLAGVLLGEHGRLYTCMVVKPDLELITGGSYILNTIHFLQVTK